jgi:hypothetical protein
LFYYFLINIPINADYRYFKPAIIQDSDGYTNIRQDASSESKIIYKINDNQIFWVEDYKPDASWNKVVYKREDENGINLDYSYRTGFIHSSRIKFLDHLTSIKKSGEKKGEYVIFSDDDITINISVRLFNKDNHTVSYSNENGVIIIDNYTPWGADNFQYFERNNAINELQSISIQNQKDTLAFHKNDIINIYFINLDLCRVYKKGNTIFIVMHNADGAGSYDVVWVVKNSKEVNRYNMNTKI